MPTYLKAYLLKDLRRYADWNEDRWREWVEAHRDDDPAPPDRLDDEEVVYIHENRVVSRGVFSDREIVFDAVTPQWKDFCRDSLGFAVPDWEEESRQVREQLEQSDDAAPEAGT